MNATTTRAEVTGKSDRRAADRRRTPYLLSDWRFAFGGRRRRTRRATDADDGHVDWYPASLLLCALAVFALSAIDATLTLRLMQLGLVEEANPFMAPLIGHDVRLFVGAKTLVTGVGVIALVIYSRLRLFRRVPMARIGWYLVVFYTLLVGYEALLLAVGRG